MSFQLKPLKEILALTKQGLDEVLAPTRARKVKAGAELKLAALDEKLITIERDVMELCAKQDIDFDKVADKMDEFDLTTRRAEQLRKIVDQLFPEAQSK